MLTDEKIREIAEKWFAKGQDAIPTIELAIREALDLDGWVKVTPETMPERGKDVLVFADGDIEIDQLHREAGTWLIFVDECVTHWRELPAPPSKETKDV